LAGLVSVSSDRLYPLAGGNDRLGVLAHVGAQGLPDVVRFLDPAFLVAPDEALIELSFDVTSECRLRTRDAGTRMRLERSARA
jgi:hypothetical protein